MKTKLISVVSLSALLFLAPGSRAAGEGMAASLIDVESGETSTATYYDDPDWVLARDFRPYLHLRSNHECMPLTFKETYGDFNTSHGDSYSGEDLSDLQDFCRDSFSSDFVVVANVVRDSTRSETFRITYGIAFGKQYSHLQGYYDFLEPFLAAFDVEESDLGTHGKDAQYIVVDVVDGLLTSVWADLHQGNYVFPRDWLTTTGNHVNVYAGKYYNSLKLDDWTVTAKDVVCDDEYSGSISCDGDYKFWSLIVTDDLMEQHLAPYMNFGDPVGSDHEGYGKLVMATNACAESTSYTSEVDGAIYSGDSLTALQGYIGCYDEGTTNVWSGSYMMQKSAYTDPYSLKGCKEGDLDGGDICNAAIDSPDNTWTTFVGTNVYMDPWVAGRPRLYSPNGVGFNDMPLKGGTRPASITIRTGSRVNMVSTTYTDGTTLSHGGSSGSQYTLSGLDTDPVVSVTMCDGEIGSDDRAGYIKLTTASGRYVEGGQGNLSCVTIAPSGKQLYGFYGRSLSELDVLGTYWGKRVSTPSVSNVSLTISGTTATGAYTFYDQYGLADSSGLLWAWADTPSSSTVYAYANGVTQTLTPSDHQKYLRLCVYPNNGYIAGSVVCSDWVYIGDLIPTVSNVSLTVSGNQAVGSFTLSSVPVSYTYDSYTYEWWRTSDTSQTGSIVGAAATYMLTSSDNNKYLRFCVTPNIGTYSGTKSCSGWTYFTPTVSNVSLTVSGNGAVGSYTLSGFPDSLTYEWWRTSDTSQAGSIIDGTAITYTLAGLDNNKYLRVCVTPNVGTNSGTKSCSGWISVGHLVSFFANPGYEGQYIHVAYEKSTLGTCFNMSTFSFNDKTSSLKFRAPTAQNAKLRMFKEANCSGDAKGLTASAGTIETVASFVPFSDLQYENEISSFLVTPVTN